MPAASVWADVIRGRGDAVWAAERFLGVKLNRGQRKWIRAATLRAADGWRPAFLTTVVSAGNQAGKTFCLAIIIWHHCFYKLGLRPPNLDDPDDIMRWMTAPYVWYHVSYQQKIARHVHRELSLLFMGDHPAQFDRATGKRRGCPMMHDFGGPIVVWDKTWESEYEYIAFHTMFGGAQIHFRNTDEKGKGLLGFQMNGISFDEAAFELYLDEVRHLVLNMRRIATGGPIHFISTPDTSSLAFKDLWEEGDPANPNRDRKTLSLRLETADNIGFGITREDYEDMKAQMPAYLWPQNLGGLFIEAQQAYFSGPSIEAAFIDDLPCPEHAPHVTEGCEVCRPGLPEEQRPISGHRYVQGCDPGIASDATWVPTLDYTNPKRIIGVRARRSEGRQTIAGIVNMVAEGHLLYSAAGSTCTTILDVSGMGGHMFFQEFSSIKPLRSFDFSGKASLKDELLTNLRSLIEKGYLKLPRKGRFWNDLRRQLLGYRRDDRKLTQDAVMALAIAVWYAVKHSGVTTAKAVDFDFYGGVPIQSPYRH